MHIPGWLLFLLYGVVGWFFIAPILGLFHEIGHALIALSLTPSKVSIVMGTRDIEKAHLRLRFGRLTVGFRLGLWIPAGLCISEADPASVRGRARVSLGGPLASLMLLLLSSVLAYWDSGVWEKFWEATASLALWGFLFTIVPMRYPHWWGPVGGNPSDELHVWQILRASKDSGGNL